MTQQIEANDARSERVPLLLSLDRATDLLGIGKWTMYELLHSGALRSVKIRSRRFIAKSDLDDFVVRLRTEAGERNGL